MPDDLKAKFERGLEELVGMCHDAGLHSVDMIEPLERWLKWAKDATPESVNQ
jgi:hypothetical protein